MSIEKYLNSEQEDVLKELINISFGMAASLIGDMLNSYAHLRIPIIDIISISDLKRLAKHKMAGYDNFYILKQRFTGEFSGETMFILDKNSARTFTTLLLGDVSHLGEFELRQPILELTNIITSACVGKLCDLINSRTIFSVPTIDLQSQVEIDGDINQYDNIITIETTLDLQNENISGYMFILLTRPELDKLKEKLNGF